MPNTDRPTSATVISWILVVSGALALIIAPLSFVFDSAMRDIVEARRPPISVSMALSTLGALVSLAGGAAMLRRQSWGRTLYLVYTPVSSVAHLALYDFSPMLLLGPLVYLVPLWFLTRPAATRYFAMDAAAEATPTPTPNASRGRIPLARRIVSVVVLVLATYLLLTLGAGLAVMVGAVVPMLLEPPASSALPVVLGMLIWLVAVAVAIGMLVGGMALWGWDARRLVLGVVLTGGGIWAALTGIVLAGVVWAPGPLSGLGMPPLPSTKGDWGHSMAAMAASGIAGGAASIAIGIAVIRRQTGVDQGQGR